MSQTIEQKRARRAARRAQRKAERSGQTSDSTDDRQRSLFDPTVGFQIGGERPTPKTYEGLRYPDVGKPTNAMLRLQKLAKKNADVKLLLELFKWQRRAALSHQLSDEYKVAAGMTRHFAQQLWQSQVKHGWKPMQLAMSSWLEANRLNDQDVVYARTAWAKELKRRKKGKRHAPHKI